ncbi:PLD nuclease N-terminal domain-containing protein [Arcobacter vandammei]|uniref:PLD nuclease N-terminal domain-containing protein n=1 Tax=Arcobacter vandammei TaxID=2782243 RepID=UPI0018DFD115|nr:PLD nuclease N-terminal domain-containing protein [Arcobacter vandammei]
MGMPSGIDLLIMVIFMIMPIVILINVIASEFKDSTNKLIWIIVILVLYPIGWILYLIFGRKHKIKKGELK